MSMSFLRMQCGPAILGFVLKARRYAVLLSLLLAATLVFPSRPAFAKKKAPDRPIDLNAATEKELEELPGVGPTTAKAIIEFRDKSGKFKRVDDLLVIRGISEGKLARIRPYVVIGPPPPPAKPAPVPSDHAPAKAQNKGR
jgi:competence protein ComEA